MESPAEMMLHCKAAFPLSVHEFILIITFLTFLFMAGCHVSACMYIKLYCSCGRRSSNFLSHSPIAATAAECALSPH